MCLFVCLFIDCNSAGQLPEAETDGNVKRSQNWVSWGVAPIVPGPLHAVCLGRALTAPSEQRGWSCWESSSAEGSASNCLGMHLSFVFSQFLNKA